MSENTLIEWADHTVNPWIGCQKVSPGCDHCYAEAWDRRFAVSGHAMRWGAGVERTRTTAANWRKPVQWNARAAEFMAQHGRRQRVFCASLADVFDNEAPAEWRADLFGLIAKTPNLDWLLLTKRIGNVVPMLRDLAHGADHDLPLIDMMPLPNVWIGATVVNQAEADRDIPKLLAVPAARRFLSIEPMLGRIYIEDLPDPAGGECLKPLDGLRWIRGANGRCETYPIGGRIDWVICGGESGPQARPMHPDWAVSLRNQCLSSGVPFLFKQWGEWQPISQQAEAFTNSLYVSNRKAAPHEEQGAIDELYGRRCTVDETVQHLDGSTHHFLEPNAFPLGAMTMYRVGKKAAGRVLDGMTHDGFPSSVDGCAA